VLRYFYNELLKFICTLLKSSIANFYLTDTSEGDI
jgi:hypothetical protein